MPRTEVEKRVDSESNQEFSRYAIRIPTLMLRDLETKVAIEEVFKRDFPSESDNREKNCSKTAGRERREGPLGCLAITSKPMAYAGGRRGVEIPPGLASEQLAILVIEDVSMAFSRMRLSTETTSASASATLPLPRRVSTRLTSSEEETKGRDRDALTF